MSRARIVVVVCCVLAGCTYKPGSFSYPSKGFPGQRVTIGCLDIAVDRRADLEGAPVLGYQFGNRCDRPVSVDLSRAWVVGRLVDGNEIALTPYDPKLEITAVRIDGRMAGGEALRYTTSQPVAQVCVDVARLVDRVTESRWLCFGDANVIAVAGRLAEREAAAREAERAEAVEVTDDDDDEAVGMTQLTDGDGEVAP